MFKFVGKIFQPWQKQQESIRLFPLPCPEHHVALIPIHQGNGIYTLFCAHCQIASQPVESSNLPAQTSQEGQQNQQPTGTLLHMHNAKKRTVERLKATRLVLASDFDGNSKPGDTDALDFANTLTDVGLPRVKVGLPDVG